MDVVQHALTAPQKTTPVTSQASNIELFGSFHLGKDEFALLAGSIREVVNYPDKLNVIPLSPDFLEGIFNLRGVVIPVINLAKIFRHPDVETDTQQKIAIVDFDHIQVGLLFDNTGEILRIRPEQKSSLSYRDPEKHGIISGAIRLDDGNRLIQILDPSALTSIENIPQIQAMTKVNARQKTNHFHLQAERRQCVSFKVAASVFAFEMQAIQEIIDVPTLKTSVLHSELCHGRINLRGQPLAIVDFCKLLEIAANSIQVDSIESDKKVIVVKIADNTIGLLVDSVVNMFSFFPEDILPIPLLSKARAGMFTGCIQKENTDAIILLNHEAVFSDTEVRELVQGHRNLYQDEATAEKSGNTQDKTNKVGRQVYITFSLDNIYAVEIKDIREIIVLPKEPLAPPGLPSFVHGIYNLRKQVITLIDLRKFYAMDPLSDMNNSKVLIVELGTERYGLIVDAVENIMTASNADRMATSGFSQNNHAAHGVRNDMREVLNIDGPDGTRKTILVFDTPLFLDRLTKDTETI